MKKNKLYILLSILTLICFLGTSAICNQCMADTIEETGEDEVTAEEEAEENEDVALESEEPSEGEEDTEVEEEETEEEKPKEEQKEAPTITLEIYEGPIYSSADDICYYRIKAVVTGNPTPSVVFSKDDSGGAWGSRKTQVNLSYPTETYTLTATATNSEDTATDSIDLNWGCPISDDPPEETSPETTIVQINLHPSDIGHIIQYLSSPHVVDTTKLIIGDSSSNTNIRGYFAFDVSSLSGAEIITAVLVLNTYKLHGDPTFKDNIGLRWGAYLPLDPNDYLMLGTHPVISYYNDKEPIEFSRGDLIVAIDNMANINNDKLQFAIGYSNDSSDGDGMIDGREYRIEDIVLQIEYIP